MDTGTALYTIGGHIVRLHGERFRLDKEQLAKNIEYAQSLISLTDGRVQRVELNVSPTEVFIRITKPENSSRN